MADQQRPWGPTHQRVGRLLPAWARWVLGGLLLGYMATSVGTVTAVVLGGVPVLIGLLIYAGHAAPPPDPQLAVLAAQADDPLVAVREHTHRHGSGVYLGYHATGAARFSRPQRAVLVLGPPRSGKTSAVIVPSILAHTGPVVSTSTKPDVARATRRVRSRDGRVWVFDPTGRAGEGDGQRLRWSPVTAARDWEGALLMARAMTAGVGRDTTSGSHWAKRAQALLAPMLHAAANTDQPMETVVDWIMRHDLDTPGTHLENEQTSRLAFSSLVGLLNTEPRELASIFSAAADAIDAYSSETALENTRDPNFNAGEFVRSSDSVFIYAPAERQQAAAPIVCGLLAEIRRATYTAHADRRLRARVLFALDEAANIAPLEELPQIASEGGSQGIELLVALQDLSQARVRWGQAADGFLTLFSDKLLLRGIADTTTLEAVSVALGEYDRRVISRSQPAGGLIGAVLAGERGHKPSTTTSTQRTRVLSPGDIARLPQGKALHLDGLRWELIELTPAHTTEPWRTLLNPPNR